VIAAANTPLGGPLFAFAGGGTGGHLYPAIAVARALRDRVPDARFIFFSTQRGIDGSILGHVDCEVVRQELRALSARPWRWHGVLQGLRGARHECRSRFLIDPPAAVIGTGGMASIPAVQEARRAGIPIAILNPDAAPGRANRYLAKHADVVFAQWDDTVAAYPPGVAVRVVGCPVRPAFAAATRETGVARFGLHRERRTLLVTGASQGARSINQGMIALRSWLESRSNWQILHLTGESDHAFVASAYASRKGLGKVLSYTEHMADAVAAADLVISRAGASTLAELTAVGRAAILMPYPFHRDQHQLANAECLERVGAARIVRDAIDPGVNAPALQSVLGELMSDDAKRAAIAEAARRMGRLDADETIACEVLKLARIHARGSACESVEAALTCTR